VRADFTFGLVGVPEYADQSLLVSVVFDEDHALKGEGDTRLLFASDAGDGTALLQDYYFSWGMFGSGDVVGDVIRSAFFDIYGGGSVFASGAVLTAFADLSYYTLDNGCAFGVTAVGLGLGADTNGDCNFFEFDGAGPQVALTRLNGPDPVPTPEPAAAGLLGLAVVAIAARRPRKPLAAA
jgi:hypothetical protein